MFPRTMTLLAAGLTCLLLGTSQFGHAQSYPSRPLKLVVPTAPGGTADRLGRVVGQKMGEILGQPVVVENRPGASAMTGTDAVAKAEADGYTLLLAFSEFTLVPSLHKTVPYDPIKDFAPVSFLGSAPFLLVVNPVVPAQSVKDLIALAKAKPGALNYASGGIGGSLHLAGEQFRSMSGIDVLHVPYQSSPMGIADLLAGRVQFMFPSLITVEPHVRAGKLRALAVTSAKRSSAMPDLPTVAETALPGYEATIWYGILAPAKTPQAIVQRLNVALRKVLDSKELQQQFAAWGVDCSSSTPEEFGRFIAVDLAKWPPIVKGMDLK